MDINMDMLSLSEALKAPTIPILSLLTTSHQDGTSLPMNQIDGSNSAAAGTGGRAGGARVSDMTTSLPIGISTTSTRFSIERVLLPGRGRSYVATRRIQPQELVFVAEAYGSTMCDSWLDCGVCHFCWTTIQDTKVQIRLPKGDGGKSDGNIGISGNDNKGGRKKKPKKETVMVFCDEICHQLYGPGMAQWICRVEQKIRRPWRESGARHWKLRFSTVATAAAATVTRPPSSAASSHYSAQVQRALRIAHTRQQLLELNDQDLTLLLDCLWNALDGLIEEQILALDVETPFQQAQYEALIPKLMAYLMTDDNWANIATRTADDDCEVIRFVSEVLYRRQMELQHPTMDYSLSSFSTASGTRLQGEPVTFADYCAMQPNELTVFREQLKTDMEEAGADEIQDPIQESGATAMAKDKGGHSGFMIQWRQLLSILPSHILGCFYIYMRMRDAHLLLTLEDLSAEEVPSSSLIDDDDDDDDSSSITPSIDSTLFRTTLYAEVANSFGIWHSPEELVGFAVFPRASFFNHSCRPNIDKKRRQGTKARLMEYWSTTVIEAGEECCISYGDISTTREERQRRLEEMYFFKCSCPRCLEEEAAEH